MKQKRYADGSYTRSQETCKKDQESKQKNRKEKFENISRDEVIKIYEDLLAGKISRFPLGLFQFGDYKERGIWLFRYLIEEKLKVPITQLLDFVTLKNLKKYRLGSQVLQKSFDRKLWNVISWTYPEKKNKEEKRSLNNVWVERPTIDRQDLIFQCKEIAEKLDNPLSFFTTKSLEEANLINAQRQHFLTTWELLDSTFPLQYKKWQLKNQNNIWTKGEFKNYELGREATKWLVEEKLKIDPRKIPGTLNYKTYKKHGLESMLSCLYNSSYIETILDCYSILCRNDFPQTQKLANLGYEYEAICKKMLERRSVNVINKEFKTKSKYCPDLVFDEKHWGDIKISTTSYFNSSTKKYFEKCESLTIIFLVKNQTVKNTKKLKFITIDKLIKPTKEEIIELSLLKQKYYKLLKE